MSDQKQKLFRLDAAINATTNKILSLDAKISQLKTFIVAADNDLGRLLEQHAYSDEILDQQSKITQLRRYLIEAELELARYDVNELKMYEQARSKLVSKK